MSHRPSPASFLFSRSGCLCLCLSLCSSLRQLFHLDLSARTVLRSVTKATVCMLAVIFLGYRLIWVRSPPRCGFSYILVSYGDCLNPNNSGNFPQQNEKVREFEPAGILPRESVRDRSFHARCWTLRAPNDDRNVISQHQSRFEQKPFTKRS